MSYEEIMAEIEANLTGDPKHDIKYLKEQCDKYKGSENEKEIIRACGRLMANALPEEAKAKITEAMNNDFSKFEKKLEEVRFNQYQKKYDKALEIIEPLIKDIEEMYANGLYADDKVSEYFCFDSPMEEVLYTHFNHGEKDIRNSDIPYASIYMEYGSLLIDLDRWEDAQQALEKAREWNPASTSIIFELCETYKHLNQLQLYFDTVRDTFKYCFEPDSVARAYRDLGWYFVEKEMYDEAIAVYAMSFHFENNEHIQAELFYISQKTGKQIEQPDIEDMKKIADKYEFPLGAHEDVLGIAYAIGKNALDNNQKESAQYFLGIVYSLTDDDDIKALLDKID